MTAEPNVRTVSGESGIAGMLKAALPSLPGVNQLPGVRKTGRDLPDLTLRREARVDPERVRAYADLCGFPTKDVVPLPYLHLIAFPLHTALMSDPSFPFPAVGTVHVENEIVRHRPVVPGEAVTATVHAENLRPHPKGRVYDVVAEVRAGDEVVWESTSSYLRIGRSGEDGKPSPGRSFGEAPTGAATWRLPGDLGRRYAAVSGDSNPIHLYPLTAKALGFRRHIAHGMWTLARATAMLENRLPEAVRVEASFKKPIFLPGTVRFGSRASGDGFDFAVRDPKSGAPHLLGRTGPA